MGPDFCERTNHLPWISGSKKYGLLGVPSPRASLPCDAPCSLSTTQRSPVRSGSEFDQPMLQQNWESEQGSGLDPDVPVQSAGGMDRKRLINNSTPWSFRKAVHQCGADVTWTGDTVNHSSLRHVRTLEIARNHLPQLKATVLRG